SRVAPRYSGSAEGRPAAAPGAAGPDGRDLVSTADATRALAGAAPFAASSAIGVLTATWSVPSGRTIFGRPPSAAGAIAILALSVALSASRSPGLTLSPSAFSQRAILPSVIVGDSAGIKTSVAINSGLGQHICPQFGRIRLGAVLGELRRRGDEA